VTYLELCQALRREAGAAGTGPANVEGQTGEYKRIVEWIANEWLRLQERHQRWNFAWAQGSLEVEPSFRVYDLPSDVAVIDPDTLYYQDRDVALMPWYEFREQFREPSGGGVRRAALDPSGQLHLEDFPDSTTDITFEYWREPQILQSNNDVPRAPSVYHYAIVYAALRQYGLYENAPEVVQQADYSLSGVYQAMVNRELPGVEIQGPLA
jgi:hypothetical protein